MTPAWALVTILCLSLLLPGLLLRNGPLLLLSLPYLIFALAPFWKRSSETRLKAGRRIEPEHVRGDQPCRIIVSLMNQGRALEDVEIADVVATGVRVEGDSTFHGPLGAGRAQSLDYTARSIRGRYEFPGLKVCLHDLLGLRCEQDFVPCPGTMVAVPVLEKLEKITITPRRTQVYTGMVRSRESGPGVEFFGTRAYVPGDPLRYLNWKAGARWDLFVTNLFEQERVSDVGLILDARHVAEVRSNGASLFEHSVRAAGSLADYFITQGNRVGLFINGASLEWTFPGYGKRQRSRIFDALVRAKLGRHEVFKDFQHLPTRLFPAQSQIMMVSPLLPWDVNPMHCLRARGYQVAVVSPDPIAFEKRAWPPDECTALAERIARMERETTVAKLRRAGILVAEWDVATPLWLSIRRSLCVGR